MSEISIPSPRQIACVMVVARSSHQRLNQEDKALERYCDDFPETDTFNQCVNAGWLKAWHNSMDDSGYVELTDLGRQMLVRYDP